MLVFRDLEAILAAGSSGPNGRSREYERAKATSIPVIISSGQKGRRKARHAAPGDGISNAV
ncbi:hypothetical protein GCM10009096_26980 [Parasphingorhabdus litoris]|uniref:Uncharacterized protein n=1 Tax=Parasphingorhabdus litoris TaxID=394733 RepID=A0ABN1ASW1_9SPHN